MDEKVEVRKPNGQFGPGNKTGGRKRRTDEEDVKALFQRTVSLRNREDIIRKAIYKARGGDDRARKFIFDYLYGPPVEHKVLTDMDDNPLIIRVIYDDEKVENA